MEEIDEFCQWSASTTKDHNIYATLNYNLQKYEHQHKNYLKAQKSFRINRFTHKEKTFNSHRNIQYSKQQNKENMQMQNCYLDVQIAKGSVNNRVPKEEKQIRKLIRSNCSSRQETEAIKLKEVKFEHKNRKKAKDRWVDIFSGLKGGHNIISLKQIDNINKQTKEEKKELFLKLLKK